MHNLIEKKLSKRDFKDVLEIGAHNSEHLEYVTHAWKSYKMIDLVLPNAEVLKNLPSGASFEVANVDNLPFENQIFDRVIVTCVLHHLTDPEKSLQEVRRVLKEGGQLDILLPNDPGFVYRFIKYFTSNLSAIIFTKNSNSLNLSKFLEVRYAMKLFHIREHRNHVEQLRMLVKHTFRNDITSTNYWPFLLKSWNFGVFTIYSIKKSGQTYD